MIYVTGDVHGELERFSKFKKLFGRRKDYCLVCGDFGFVWDGSEEEQKKLQKLSRLRCTILFVEGTHDNLDALSRFPLEEFCGGMARRILDNVFWLQRGYVFDIAGKTVFAMGGGDSHDAEERVAGVNWWPNELPSSEEFARARNSLAQHDNHVDLIITHANPRVELGRIGEKSERADALTTFLGELVKNVRFSHWYFGSEHVDKRISAKMTAVFEKIIKTLP